MANLKITVIGAGSYVFGPSILSQLLLDHKLSGIDLALVDIDAEMVELMAGVGRRMAEEMGLDVRISAHTERAAALDGASYVVCSAARQMFQRFATDSAIAHKHDPSHIVTEFGGIAGIAYTLRQIALLEEIAADIRRHCPSALFLDSANPLPRVCQAAHELGVRAVGFCALGEITYGVLWQMTTGQPLEFPWKEAHERWTITMGGTNHFTWVTEIVDNATGSGVLAQLLGQIAAGALPTAPVATRLLRQTGSLLVPVDNHTADFLTPTADTPNRAEAGHGTADQRRQRLELLAAIGSGQAGWGPLLEKPSWERPGDLIAALSFGRPARFHSLNLINDGQLPQLRRNVFVETPALVDATGIHPRHVELPPAAAALTQRVALVHDTVVAAGLRHSRSLAHAAVELDPTVTDKAAGSAALDECMQAHADILPAYA